MKETGIDSISFFAKYIYFTVYIYIYIQYISNKSNTSGDFSCCCYWFKTIVMYLEERKKKNETHSFKLIQSHLCLNYSINIWLKVQYVRADIIEPKLEQSSSICSLEHRQILKGLSCWQLKATNCNWLQVRETHLEFKWTEWPASLGSHGTLLHRNEASQTIVMEIKSKLCLKPNEN